MNIISYNISPHETQFCLAQVEDNCNADCISSSFHLLQTSEGMREHYGRTAGSYFSYFNEDRNIIEIWRKGLK